MRYIALIAFSLTGCAGGMHSPAADARATYLVCGSAVRLDISHDGRAAVLREANGRETILQRVNSTLGTRYAGDGLSVLRSGEIYIYADRDGSTLHCDPIPR
jgi:hypothetical protein